jgi:hypothetical protein
MDRVDQMDRNEVDQADRMGRNEDRVAGLAALDLVGRDKGHPTLLRGQNN